MILNWVAKDLRINVVGQGLPAELVLRCAIPCVLCIIFSKQLDCYHVSMTTMLIKPLRFFAVLLLFYFYSVDVLAEPVVALPKAALDPSEIAIIVNDRDELSRQTGEYYRKQRNIPLNNLIHISFKPGRTNMPIAEFHRIKRQVDEATPLGVQAYVLTWLKPYRVTCMSITSAFAFGFNQDYCAQGCKTT